MRDFNHTVNVLVKAYMNDTLRHSDCHACAVGNMIAESIGISLKKGNINWYNKGHRVLWNEVFMTGFGKKQRHHPNNYAGKTKEQIDSTGYTWQELARIEKAFELSNQGNSVDEWMFNGLMDVLDVLADIHNVDLSVKEASKLLFVKL